MKLGLFFNLAGLVVSSASGAFITVTNIFDSGPGSLRQAILDGNASGSATIVLSNLNGTISLASNLPPLTGNLTFLGPGTNLLTISGGYTTRVFTVSSSAIVTIYGITIANGVDITNGGAGLFNAGTLALQSCTVASNSSRTLWFGSIRGAGGGISSSGNLSILNSTIHGNTGGDYGGGLYVTGGTATISNCTVSANLAAGVTESTYFPSDGSGGGLAMRGGSVVMINSTLIDNQAAGGSGTALPFSFRNGTSGASGKGGAVFTDGGVLRLTNCVLSNNRASGGGAGCGAVSSGSGGLAYGGCLFNNTNGIVLCESSIISGNLAVGGPGAPPSVCAPSFDGFGFANGIYNDFGTVALVDTLLQDSSVRVTYGFQPTFLAQPISQNVTIGASVTLRAHVAGAPPLSFEWKQNGSTIVPFGQGTGTLSINNAMEANVGSYALIATNVYGAATSALATVAIQCSLCLFTNGNGSAVFNTNVQYMCRASSSAPLGKGASYPLNAVAVLSATPLPGHRFTGWSGDASGGTNPLAVTMTTYKNVTANFGPITLDIATQGGGTVRQSPATNFFLIGDQVTLTATPARWYSFTGWSDGVTNNPRMITIAASNSYTAIFSPVAPLETLSFGGVSRTAPIGMPAVFVDGQFTLTGPVTKLRSARLEVTTSFTNGTIFYTLTGSPPSQTSRRFTNPITLRRSVIVRAVAFNSDFSQSWEADPVEIVIIPAFLLDVTSAGGGMTGISAPQSLYLSNTLVTLSATPMPGWTFLQWLGDASGTSATTSVRVLNRDLCAQAVFGTTLGATVTGSGSVVVDPVAGLYPYGAMVRLTAVPQTGSFFGEWGNAVMSTNNPLLFTVTNANPTVSCAFGTLSAGQVALTVLVNGRGRVSTNPRGNRFPSNQSVTLTASADADQEFLGWSGDATGTSTNLIVALTQSKVIEAHFTARPRLSLGPCLGGWREDGFQLNISGELGERYGIERSTNTEAWTPLRTLTNWFGTSQFTDVLATNRSQQFYRASQGP